MPNILKLITILCYSLTVEKFPPNKSQLSHLQALQSYTMHRLHQVTEARYMATKLHRCCPTAIPDTLHCCTACPSHITAPIPPHPYALTHPQLPMLLRYPAPWARDRNGIIGGRGSLETPVAVAAKRRAGAAAR